VLEEICSTSRWLAAFDRREEAGLTEEVEKAPAGPMVGVS